VNRPAIAALALAAVAAFTGKPAAAHPLGNFTINHLSKIAVERDRIAVRYVLDMAEIPTFAVMRSRDSGGTFDARELRAWAHDEGALIAPSLALTIDGVPTPLTLDAVRATTRHGAGGLPTLYFVSDLHARIAPRSHALAYADRTYDGRLGWRDVVVAPATEPTRELTSYPNALLGSPRGVTTADLDIAASGAVTVRAARTATDAQSPPAPSAIRSNQLSDLLARGTGNPAIVLLTLLVAVALGALHALEPGHGKTLLAVSLVGARATIRQAGILASALTIAHTAGVLALGIAIMAFKNYFVPETIYPWITLISGIAIATIGARAVARQIVARRGYAHGHHHAHAALHDHDHVHAHHPHGSHDHGDGHVHAHDDLEHARSHAMPGEAPLRFGPTVWAAMSGGVAPCPAALVVLFAALAQNALTYGIVVIVFFSLGLATTLTGLGIGVVRGASWLSSLPRFDALVRYGPLASATIIALIGCVMVGQGLVQQGLPVSAPIVTALTALAIAGYAFSHPFGRVRSVHA
jgi:nickel/cobalt exporter